VKKPSLLVIFLTVFIDLIGFGIVLPLLPRYSERFGAEGLMIGVIIASFSVMQLFLSPFWGRLSDRIGRRPVLLLSTAGSAASYALFAVASSAALPATTALGLVILSRVFAGACGANISVASAYIADITPPEQRSKGMGLIGVSFGLGFILGPALGALSASWFGLAGPGWVAAGLCLANFILACFILVESRGPQSASATARPPVTQWAQLVARPKVGLLVGIYFLSTFTFACFESTLPLLLGSPGFHPDDFRAPGAFVKRLLTDSDPVANAVRTQWSPAFRAVAAQPETQSPAALRRGLFEEFNRVIKAGPLDATVTATGRDALALANRRLLERAYPAEIRARSLYFDERQVGYLFAYCGLMSALVQGGVIGRLVKRYGETTLIWSSLVVVALSIALIPYAQGLGLLLLSLGLFSVGSGVNRAPTMGLVSIYTPAADQGAVMGLMQSAGTLARIFGPIVATGLYAGYPHGPFLVGGALAFVAAVFAWGSLRRAAGATTTP
jgi:MFS family permease